MRASRYILTVLIAGIVVPVSSIFCFNFIADPHYLWYRDSRIDIVFDMDPYARISKAYEVRRLHPKHIVLGSSRCVKGINMDHDVWPEGPRYNLAAFGAGVDEYWAYLRHAQKVNALETVIIGLDFFSFNGARAPRLPDYEHVLSYRDGGFHWQIERMRITFSATTIIDWFAATNPYKNSQRSREKQSSAKMYRDQFRVTVRYFSQKMYFAQKALTYSFERPDGISTLDFYRQIIDFCYSNEIDLKLFISPVHAVQLETIDAIGLWPSFELWKRRMVNINLEAARRASQPLYPIWDFSGYNAITSEPLPSHDGENARMKYYLDSSHYQKNVGNMILDTLFDKNRTPGFGEPLTADTIEQVLTKIRADRVVWRNQNPDDYEEFRALAQKHRPKKAIIRTD